MPRKISLQLQDRDYAFFRTLYEARGITLGDAATIHFGGRYEAAKKRVQKLKAAGYVVERWHGADRPRTLHLSAKGSMKLGEVGILAEYPRQSPSALRQRAEPSERTQTHECEVMDVKAAFHATGLQIDEFNLWPALHEFTVPDNDGTPITVQPDGFLRIVNGTMNTEEMFFLEVDRSTETVSYLVSRLVAYVRYYRSGDFAREIAGRHAVPHEHPFRVLVTLRSEERRNNVAERLLLATPPVSGQVWLSTHAEVCADPLSDCWIRPADYLDAMKTMSVVRHHHSREYRRQTARDAHIRATIRKRALFSYEKGDQLAA